MFCYRVVGALWALGLRSLSEMQLGNILPFSCHSPGTIPRHTEILFILKFNPPVFLFLVLSPLWRGLASGGIPALPTPTHLRGGTRPPRCVFVLQSYLLMATVIFLPYLSKAAGWCRGKLVGRCLGRLVWASACGEGPWPACSRPLEEEGSDVHTGTRTPGLGQLPTPASSIGPREPPAHSVEYFTFDLHEPFSKERVEAFSDGVYAIVATLLILDIW